MKKLSKVDEILSLAGKALYTLYGEDKTKPFKTSASTEALSSSELSPKEKQQSIALMRVNHTGEICAQALYESQAWHTPNLTLQQEFATAAEEELFHLAWCKNRIHELGGHTSWLGPFWYLGAFMIGSLAAKCGDEVSLGFLEETEKQVVQHLEGHLRILPSQDTKSRLILEQMQQDEAKHAHTAHTLGSVPLPLPVKYAMKWAALVMKKVSYYI